MIRSRVTLASTDAAATHAAAWSPLGTASAGRPNPRTAKPSVRTYPGGAASAATARRMPSTFATCTPRRSISAGGMTTTALSAQRRRMRS